jgi:L-asparaginase/Glu-tRNA(Gln) amidotransferase subunit D
MVGLVPRSKEYYKNRILVINTGGTMDSAYADPANPPEIAIPVQNSLLPEALKLAGIAERCDVVMGPRGDSSRFLLERDKSYGHQHLHDLVTSVIGPSAYEKIIIVHGTYFMPPNAQFLEEDLKRQFGDIKKKIIFTGSVTPLANDPRLYKSNQIAMSDGSTVTMIRKASDGVDNLKAAAKALDDPQLQTLPNKVHIVADNMLYPNPACTVKDKSHNRFVPIGGMTAIPISV